MALTAYPLAFPQLTRLATGLSVSDPRFQQQRERFLEQFAESFQTRSENTKSRATLVPAHRRKTTAK
jgi:hypothetical protein